MSAEERSDDDVRSGGSTSRSLLAEAKVADPAAWERIVRLYAPLVASWCRRWGVAEQDIGDVLQDVFSAVASHLDRFHKDRPSDTFRGWLSTISRNKVRDYFRRRASEPSAAGGTEATHRLQQVPQPGATGEPTEWTDDQLLGDLLHCAWNRSAASFTSAPGRPSGRSPSRDAGPSTWPPIWT